MKKKRTMPKGALNLTASLVSILAGLLVGFILLMIFNFDKALYGFGNIIFTGLRSPDRFAKVLYTAAPLLMTGLSVGFAFKTGLFNIGASGQYTVGAVLSLVGAIMWQLPWYASVIRKAPSLSTRNAPSSSTRKTKPGGR